MNLNSPQRVHFIGIGGVGMSAIAKVLLERGAEVTGSDLKRSRVASVLEAMGATVHIGHDPAHVDQASTVVVSSAISRSNPEYQRALELNLEVITRGKALAAVLEGFRSVVIAGTHGKTTTTSMIVTVLQSAGIDPTFLVGAGLNDSGTNARAGTSDIAVAEADESDGSFLLLKPHVSVITNLEMDHIDHWGTMDALTEAFREFALRTDEDGCLVVPATDAELLAMVSATGRRILSFGEGGDIEAVGVDLTGLGARFTLRSAGSGAEVELRVPGTHNVANALAAAAAALSLGVSLEDVARGLSGYRGVERRFQVRGEIDGVTVVDDYAHHPTEIAATLAAARSGPWKRVVAIFQPHRFSRTQALAAEFGAAFEGADQVIFMDVYGAGEEAIPGVSGKLLVDAVCRASPGRRVAFFPHRADMLRFTRAVTRPGDLLLTMGAGDVTGVGEELLELGTAG
ncbi:MAG: UDP-N-acetylmuramate--L-alanine ligase [Actinomycetota bacterium]